MPFIRSTQFTKATDQVYRDIERGSEIRAQAAADMLGISAAETGLKVTNLKDNTVPGEIAAIEDKGAEQRLSMGNAFTPSFGGFGGNNGVEYSAAVQTGPHANSGVRTQIAIRGNHQQAISTHCVGKDGEDPKRAVVPQSQAVYDAPSKQWLDPGYRRRA